MLISLHVSDELLKLAKEGFGQYIDKTEMENDKILEPRKCFSAFMKNDIRDVDPTFSVVSMKMIAVQNRTKLTILKVWILS